MVLKELLGLIDLLAAQTLCIYKTMKVIVICKDKNLMLVAFQVVVPSLEYFNNGWKLSVVGLILSFCRNYFPQKKDYWIPLAQIGLSNYLSGLVPEANWLNTPLMA